MSRKVGDSESASAEIDNLMPNFLQVGNDVLLKFASLHILVLVLSLVNEKNLKIVVDKRTIEPWVGIVMRQIPLTENIAEDIIGSLNKTVH